VKWRRKKQPGEELLDPARGWAAMMGTVKRDDDETERQRLREELKAQQDGP